MSTGEVLSISVGILSLLVVVLIGWQIYSIFNIRGEIKDIRGEVSSAIRRINTESERLSTTVYITIFDEIRKKNEDVYGYFKYGLLIILHAEGCGEFHLCSSMIQALKESFPVMKSIKNEEKADILSIAAKISESGIKQQFGDLHSMIITKIPSCD